MKRRAFLLAGMGLCASGLAQPGRFNHGLLWRITKDAIAPSHVYGTIHVGDPRVQGLPGEVEAAFSRARSLMLEFVPDPYARERFLEAALYVDGTTLEREIGAADFERALEQLAPIGLSREFVNKLKPWGVLLNLRNAGAPEGSPLDGQLLERARSRRMPVSQIEGVEEQVFTFDEFPMESQVALLKHSLAHRDELLALAERTMQAYLARDLAGIWRLREEFSARYPGIAAHQAVMTKRVVHDRNVVMAFRMQRELRRGSAFIAVGALHLYGEKGVLALLEEDGYRATRVF
ncbi:MAG TPA: TraB/GumN family protein [Burkholderiales bacterium]|nr:TraB/GumN family protein [Burkholderiales bacterium]